jgi:hypothetical protein
MDLVERYVAAIGRQLPPKQSADIQAELRDELLTRVEAREAELGRPLARAELETLLIEFGHPLVVAGRYRKTQHLIGPEVFPFWWLTVKWMLAIVLGVYLVLIAIGVAIHQVHPDMGHTTPPSALPVVIYLFGIITLVFAAFERFGKTAFLREWKPSRLPPAAAHGRSVATLAGEIAMGLVFLAWWFGLIHFRNFLPPFVLTVDLAPVWRTWFWPIAAYSFVEIGADIYALAQPQLGQRHRAILIARYLAGMVVLAGVLQAGHWLVVRGTLPAQAMAEVQTNFDLGFQVGIGLTIVGMGVAVAIEARRWVRARQAEALQPA